MAEHTTVKSNKTQVTERVLDVMPDLTNACQAIVTTQVLICEPMTNGTWRLVTSFQDNYNIVLEERMSDAARREVTSRLMEIKQKWQSKDLIISLENLLSTEEPNSVTEPTTPSPAHLADNR